MQVTCLRCGSSVEISTESTAVDSVCPQCGSSIEVPQKATADYKPVRVTRRIGKFELQHVVGSGAFGTVYMARDSELDRVVAIKIPRLGSLCTVEDIERFKREARAAAQLKHPLIISILEVGVSGEEGGEGRRDEIPFIVSEFVRGVSLDDFLSSRTLNFREASELIASVADALDFAHRQGVTHRDVKPANIMLEPIDSQLVGSQLSVGNARIRLMDFGLARREAGEITMTMDGQVLGTPAYMSPEQAMGQGHEASGRADIYSLGVILYQLLTGELPFRGTARMLLHQLLHEEARRPRLINQQIPRDLETICLKAIDKEAGRRYATAAEMAVDLRLFLNGEPIKSRPVSRVERVWRWSKRNPVVVSLMAAVLFATLGAILIPYFDGSLANRKVSENSSQMSLFLMFIRFPGILPKAVVLLGFGLGVAAMINLCLGASRRVLLIQGFLSLLPLISTAALVLMDSGKFRELATGSSAPNPAHVAAFIGNAQLLAIFGIGSSIIPIFLTLVGLAIHRESKKETK